MKNLWRCGTLPPPHHQNMKQNKNKNKKIWTLSNFSLSCNKHCTSQNFITILDVIILILVLLIITNGKSRFYKCSIGHCTVKCSTSFGTWYSIWNCTAHFCHINWERSKNLKKCIILCYTWQIHGDKFLKSNIIQNVELLLSWSFSARSTGYTGETTVAVLKESRDDK